MKAKSIYKKEGKSLILDKILDKIEKVGNKLPDPVTIFIILCIVVMIVSTLISNSKISVVHPMTKETVKAVNLLEKSQLQKFLGNIVSNFQGFAPLGLVLVTMLGAGVAEKSGFMESLMKKSISKVPKKLITLTIIFVGIVSNAAGDAGFIVLPPLAAIVFLGIGRHPLVGMFVGYAGVAGGFAANIMVNMSDVLLIGFTTPAAQIMDPNYIGNPAINFYFKFVATILLTIAATFVTERYIEPRFKKYEDLSEDSDVKDNQLTDIESKGLKYALYACGIVCLLLIVLCIGDNAFMRDAKTGSLLSSNAPLMKGIVPIILIIFLVPGLVYGKVTKSIKNDKELVCIMGKSMSDMGAYIVLAFAAAQFLYLFNESNLGTILSIEGAKLLSNAGIGGKGLIVGFIFLSAFINLFVGSASAKWAIMAPIFIPMFMLLGYDPALTQMAYRIGDSITNPISPLFPFFPILLAFAKRYDKDIGVGTVIANMIPFSFAFSIVLIVLLVIFMAMGLPLGPGGGIWYNLI